MTVARISLALLMGLLPVSCSCQDTTLEGDMDTENGSPDSVWADAEGMPDLDWILQTPENEEMPEFVMDADVLDLFSDETTPEPWVPEFWDVDFDYLDVAPDYVPDPELCGNGVVDPGEECDDANDDDNDACTTLCLLPRCGDGSVWYDMEDCDPPGTVRPCVTDCGSMGREWCMPFCRWEGECIPPVETCGNGADDDCDGIVDTLVRLIPSVRVSEGPLGSGRSKLAWSSSEFLVMWESADGSTMLSRLDPWGRKTAWDWIVNRFFNGLIHFAWTGSNMGTFLGYPGYEEESWHRWPVVSHLFFRALLPDGSPLSDFLAVADSQSTTYNMGHVLFASSEDGHGVLFHRIVEVEHHHSLTTDYAYLVTLSTDGASVSAETVLGSSNYSDGSGSYWSCLLPTVVGYAALRNQRPEDTWALDQLTFDGTLIDSRPLALPPNEYELPLLECMQTDSTLVVMFYYDSERRIELSFWEYDGVFAGSHETIIDYDVDPLENDHGGGLIETAVADGEIGLFWTDTRDGNQELYFSRIGPAGAHVAGPARLTWTAEPSRYASAVWDGEAYAVTWLDTDGLNEDIFFTRLAPCP